MQFTKPSFLETKIEEKFIVLKSKNEKDKNKLLKKEIDLNFIQFHFVIVLTFRVAFHFVFIIKLP